MILLLLGCAPEPPTVECAEGEAMVGLMSSMVFVRAEGMVSEGFDLDGRVSDASDDEACNVADYTSASGAEGIDNAWARLLPALENTEGAQIEAIIDSAIHNGALMLAFDVQGYEPDGCGTVTLRRGVGVPMLGTDGELEWGQTIEEDPATEPMLAEATFVDGVVEAGPLDLDLPVSILGVDLLFPIRGARVRLEPQEDGSMKGLLGGGTIVDYLLEVASTENVDPELVGLLEGLLGLSADLEPGAEGCEQVSVTFAMDLVPAWIYEGE